MLFLLVALAASLAEGVSVASPEACVTWRGRAQTLAAAFVQRFQDPAVGFWATPSRDVAAQYRHRCAASVPGAFLTCF
jgi:hypothetical protein